MDTLVYECAMDDCLTFQHLLDMSDIDRVRLMMSRVCTHYCWIFGLSLEYFCGNEVSIIIFGMCVIIGAFW